MPKLSQEPKPSVLLINRVYPPARGATGRILRDLSRGFSKSGWDVTVLTTHYATRKSMGKSNRKSQEKDGPIHIHRTGKPLSGKGTRAYIGILISLFFAAIRLRKHDLVITMTDPPVLVFAGYLISRIKGTKHIHWCQDVYPDILPALDIKISRLLTKICARLADFALKRCDKIIVIGRCMARYLARNHDIKPSSKIAVIPNWPDEMLLSEQGQKRLKTKAMHQMKASEKRKVAAVPEEFTDVLSIVEEEQNIRAYDDIIKSSGQKFRVIYSGNLGKAHPFDTIIDAASILQENMHDIEFVFVGDGPNFDTLAKTRSKRNLENIRFLPYQPASRLRDLLESGDVHLVTMDKAAAGLMVPCKVYSAFAVGRPCIFIGPKRTEIAEVIKDFSAGEIVPHGKPKALAHAIKTYRTDSKIWFAAYEGAKEAGAVFTPDQSIDAFVKRASQIIQEV